MNENRNCPECGAELPPGAEETPCPGCLMKLGMQSWADRRRGAGQGGTAAPTTPLGDRFVPPDPEELSKLFPQLEIMELLGKGGMGAVYKARQPGLDRLVAVKILPAEIGTDAAFAERFAREARALARLNHPNIVGVYDYGETSGLYYFVMEYVDGANLRQLVREQTPEPQQALALVGQICDALQFAHDEGIVHRDIKPENILVDRRGRAKIADFGLAKLLDKTPAETALTEDRQAMGTLHYMAPEQMAGSRGVDHRADLYSLGVVFYELLTGHLPLGRFPLPSKSVHVDVRLDEIVLRSLEREPERRYQRASEIKTDIQTVTATPIPASVRPAERPQKEDSTAVPDRLQGPTILLLIVGILNLLSVMAAVVAIPAGFFFGLPLSLGLVEILAIACVLPIAILQVVAGLMLRKRQGWGLGIMTSIFSLLPCGLGWFISVVAGIWTLVALNSPEVKAAFGQDAPLPGQPQSSTPAAVPTGPPRFSRKAIVGALWAPLFLLLVLAIVPAFVLRQDAPTPPGASAPQPTLFLGLVGLLALALGGSSVFGTTILGLLGIRDIRGSGGRIVGMPLALADALLFPLLLLDALIAGVLLALLRFLPIATDRSLVWIALPAIIFVWLVVNTLLIWLGWRIVRIDEGRPNDSQGVVPPDQSGKVDSEAGTKENGSERPRKSVAGRVLLALLLCAMVGGAAVAAAKIFGFPASAATRLTKAIHQGDTAAAERLLATSPNLLEVRDDERLTPLNIAALRGDTALVRRLLDRGAEINTVDMYGETPLIKAAGLGHVSIVSALLARGAEVDQRDRQGETALMLAADRGHLSVVEALLKAEANADAQDNNGSTALLLASSAGNEEIVKLLLEHGVTVDAVTKGGLTPLVEATARGNLAIVKVLLEHGADVNHATAFGETALVWAVGEGHEPIVEYLLANGANIEHRGRDGRGILHYAATDALYQKLRDAGAPVGRAELFREGLQRAKAGKYTEAATSFEQAQQTGAATDQPLQANVNGWKYEVADGNLTIPVLLAACYALSGDSDKARQVAAEMASWADTKNLVLYQRERSDTETRVLEKYELNKAAFQRFLESPDQPLTLQLYRDETTERPRGGGFLRTSSQGQNSVSGVFH